MLALYMVVNFFNAFQFVDLGRKTSQNLHDVTICSLIKTSMSFFHKNSTGSILNRMAKDLGVVDDELKASLKNSNNFGVFLWSEKGFFCEFPYKILKLKARKN